MNLVISDYDGTIKRIDKNSNLLNYIDFYKDIKAIRKFIDEDNIFAISTSRKTNSILNELNKYNIKYNYLSTYQGLVLLDSYSNIINANYLKIELLNCLKEYLKIIKDITMYNEYGKETLDNNVIRAEIQFESLFQISNLIKDLKEIEDINIIPTRKMNKIYIQKKSNKCDGVKCLMNYLKISNDHNIITIGNSFNDEDMISKYNGYYIYDENSEIAYNDNYAFSIREVLKKIKR